MRKTKNIATIHNGNTFIERQIYMDKENNKFVKISNVFVSITILEEYYKYKVDIWL
jgi:hypothetical protein